jgi:hypothetical protein
MVSRARAVVAAGHYLNIVFLLRLLCASSAAFISSLFGSGPDGAEAEFGSNV